MANIDLQQQALDALDVLSRAKKAFGADTTPVDPPSFGPPKDLEQNVGRGRF